MRAVRDRRAVRFLQKRAAGRTGGARAEKTTKIFKKGRTFFAFYIAFFREICYNRSGNT